MRRQGKSLVQVVPVMGNAISLSVLILMAGSVGSASPASTSQGKENSTDNGDLALGFQALQAKDYAKALGLFNSAARKYPDLADVHYGRGSALEQLNRREESVKEFKLCLLLSPPPKMQEQCNRELDFLTFRPHVDSAPTAFGEQDIEHSMTTITNQAKDRMQAIKQNSSPYDPASYPKLPTSKKHDVLWPSSHPTYGNSPALSFDPARTNYRYRSMTYNTHHRHHHYFNPTGDDFRSSLEDTQQRSRAIRDSAEALGAAMTTKPSENSGVYLSPINTNLYVRNYLNFDTPSQEPLQALKATQLTLPMPTKKLPSPDK